MTVFSGALVATETFEWKRGRNQWDPELTTKVSCDKILKFSCHQFLIHFNIILILLLKKNPSNPMFKRDVNTSNFSLSPFIVFRPCA